MSVAPSRGWWCTRAAPIAGTGVVTMLAVVFVAANRREIPTALRAARAAEPGWLALAILLSLAYLLVLAVYHHATFRALDLPIAFRRILLLAPAAHFLNQVTTSGGFGGLAVYLGDAARRGLPRGPVVAAYLLIALLGQLTFALVLAAGLAVAWWGGQLTAAVLAATGVFALYTLVHLLVVIAAARSRAAVRFVYGLPARLWHRLGLLAGRQRRSPPDHVHADELHEAVGVLLDRPGALVPAALAALLIDAVVVAGIWAVLRALGVEAGVALPLVAYSIEGLFSVVGFLPAGIGFAEAGLGVVFVAYGLPGATAAVAVLLSRLVEMWIPVVLGAYAAQAVARGRRPA